jgi:hypothetical protein
LLIDEILALPGLFCEASGAFAVLVSAVVVALVGGSASVLVWGFVVATLLGFEDAAALCAGGN